MIKQDDYSSNMRLAENTLAMLSLSWMIVAQDASTGGSNVYDTNTSETHPALPVPRDWCNKCRGMCYPVCGIKEPLLLIGNSSLFGGSGFPLSLTEWSFTICLKPYNRK